MAIITTRIDGASSQAGYGYYANVLVWDTINSNNTFTVQVNTYIVNNGSRFNTNGWTKHTRINNVGEETLTNQSINTTNAGYYGETLVHSKTYNVPLTMSQIYVVSYLEKSSYASYEPGYCNLYGYVSMPKVQSTWTSSLLSLNDVTANFKFPITKYVDSYYDCVEVRTTSNNASVTTFNGVSSSTNYHFDTNMLSTIYANTTTQYPLELTLNLKTYTNSSKTTQVGNTLSIPCKAYIVNGNPTYTTTTAEQDSKVSTFLGSTTSSKVILNASDLKFTIVVTTKNSATVKSVKINGSSATLSSGTTYTKTLSNLTTASFNIEVVDSRGLTATSTVSKTPISYTPCKINSWSIARASATSSDLKLTADISCTSASTLDSKTNNKVVRYSKNNSSWTTIPSSSYTMSNNKITISNLTLSNIVDYTASTPFYLDVYDSLTESKDNKTITKGVPTIYYGKTDFGVNGTLYVNNTDGGSKMDVKSNINSLTTKADNATATISTSGTTKRSIKYGNGILINTLKITKSNIAVSTAWGSMYQSNEQTVGDYLTAFTELYSVNITCHPQLRSGEVYNFWYMLTASDESLTASPKVRFLRATSGTVSAIIYVTAIGKWK